jgi:hypothetical protein
MKTKLSKLGFLLLALPIWRELPAHVAASLETARAGSSR